MLSERRWCGNRERRRDSVPALAFYPNDRRKPPADDRLQAAPAPRPHVKTQDARNRPAAAGTAYRFGLIAEAK
jgi:hypothetical protein